MSPSVLHINSPSTNVLRISHFTFSELDQVAMAALLGCGSTLQVAPSSCMQSAVVQELLCSLMRGHCLRQRLVH